MEKAERSDNFLPRRRVHGLLDRIGPPNAFCCEGKAAQEELRAIHRVMSAEAKTGATSAGLIGDELFYMYNVGWALGIILAVRESQILRLGLCPLRTALSGWRRAAESIRGCGWNGNCAAMLRETESGNGNGAWPNASNRCDVAPMGARCFISGRAGTGLCEGTEIGV